MILHHLQSNELRLATINISFRILLQRDMFLRELLIYCYSDCHLGLQKVGLAYVSKSASNHNYEMSNIMLCQIYLQINRMNESVQVED